MPTDNGLSTSTILTTHQPPPWSVTERGRSFSRWTIGRKREQAPPCAFDSNDAPCTFPFSGFDGFSLLSLPHPIKWNQLLHFLNSTEFVTSTCYFKTQLLFQGFNHRGQLFYCPYLWGLALLYSVFLFFLP